MPFLPDVPTGSEVGVGVGGRVNELVEPAGGLGDGVVESTGRDVGEPIGNEMVTGALAGAKPEPATLSPGCLGFLPGRPFPVGEGEIEGAVFMALSMAAGSYSVPPSTAKTV